MITSVAVHIAKGGSKGGGPGGTGDPLGFARDEVDVWTYGRVDGGTDRQSVRLSVRLSVHQSVRPSVSLSVRTNGWRSSSRYPLLHSGWIKILANILTNL